LVGYIFLQSNILFVKLVMCTFRSSCYDDMDGVL